MREIEIKRVLKYFGYYDDYVRKLKTPLDDFFMYLDEFNEKKVRNTFNNTLTSKFYNQIMRLLNYGDGSYSVSFVKDGIELCIHYKYLGTGKAKDHRLRFCDIDEEGILNLYDEDELKRRCFVCDELSIIINRMRFERPLAEILKNKFGKSTGLDIIDVCEFLIEKYLKNYEGAL